MKASHSYSWYSKCYTLRYSVAAAVGIVLVLFFVGEAPSSEELFQQLARGAVILLVVMLTQYFITERNAKYWPLSVSSSGLTFHAGPSSHEVSWNNIKSIEAFPSPNEKAPKEWSQALFSRGTMIYTFDGKRFVIYKKIGGYNSLLNKIQEHMRDEAT